MRGKSIDAETGFTAFRECRQGRRGPPGRCGEKTSRKEDLIKWTARYGSEALTGLRLHKMPQPDLIFLDLNMPRVNGLGFLQEIRKDSMLQEIPKIIYSTSKVEKDEHECKKIGAVHFITSQVPSKGSAAWIRHIYQ